MRRVRGKGIRVIFTATSDGWLDLGDRKARCALGPAGVKPGVDKREGDGASPAGVWPIREVWYRPDRGPPPATEFRVRAMAPDDGWCDDPQDPRYNRHVKLPYPASAERLWRDDEIYDIVVVLGHNDDPPIPYLGSCIFLHLARPGFTPTQGCVAMTRADLEDLLARAQPGDAVEIRG
jgi:L,D-peptidoglycan transpeptidase YkuD (ErfK/YbiS/YcfS/YnhG family)